MYFQKKKKKHDEIIHSCDIVVTYTPHSLYLFMLWNTSLWLLFYLSI